MKQIIGIKICIVYSFECWFINVNFVFFLLFCLFYLVLPFVFIIILFWVWDLTIPNSVTDLKFGLLKKVKWDKDLRRKIQIVSERLYEIRFLQFYKILNDVTFSPRLCHWKNSQLQKSKNFYTKMQKDIQKT